MVDTNLCKNIFEMHNNKIKSIDNKTAILISVDSFLIAAISFLHSVLFNWSTISIITILLVSLFSLILSIFPIVWNRHEKNNKNNPLHLPHLWKCKNVDEIEKSLNPPNVICYCSQIKRISEITKFKYISQWIGIILLLISIIVFIISFLMLIF